MLATMILLAAAAACQPPDNRQSEAARAPSAGRPSTVRYLDPGHPSFSVRVPGARAGENRKFVAVEIGEVRNPERHSLTFEVSFRPERGPAIPLGVFSLYPADNPGRFIVATQGKAQDGGEIVVTVADKDEAGRGDVRVGVAAVGFAPG